MPEQSNLRWIVAQIGAREHYGPARALHAFGALDTLYTDAWVSAGRSLLLAGPRSFRALAGRYDRTIPPEKVCDFTLHASINALQHNLVMSLGRANKYEEYIRLGKWFSNQVCRRLETSRIDPHGHAFFGFNTSSLEILRCLKQKGVLCIIDQIDPGRTEEKLVLEEHARWPHWVRTKGRIPEAYYDRISAEWDGADIIVVNSEWTRSALQDQGVDERKIHVVPLAYETLGRETAPRSRSECGELEVLWLGSVNLRKGIPYLLEAARLLERSSIKIKIAGPIDVSRHALASLPSTVTILGRVTRDQAQELYRAADVFVLPTISDGFAITQLEAMAHGLPVVATPNCGSVVRDGIDGYIVPIRSSSSIAERLLFLAENPDVLAQMRVAALQRVKDFSLQNYGEGVLGAAASLRGDQCQGPNADRLEDDQRFPR